MKSPKINPVPTALIAAITASEAANDREHLVLNVRMLGEKYRLPLDVQQSIAAFGMDMRGRGILETVETTTLALKAVFEGLEL